MHQRFCHGPTSAPAAPTIPTATRIDSVRESMLMALGRSRHLRGLSNPAIVEIAADFRQQNETVLREYTDHITGLLDGMGSTMAHSVKAQVKSALEEFIAASDCPADYRTRDALLKDTLRPTETHKRDIGFDDAGNELSVYDIRVEDTLTKLAVDASVADQIHTPHRSHPTLIRSPRDGSAYRKHPLFSVHPGALCFQLYAGCPSFPLLLFLPLCALQMIMSSPTPSGLSKASRKSRLFIGVS